MSAGQGTGLPPLTAGLLETGEWSDFTLKCEEQLFKVHKVVVCLQSNVIARSIRGDFLEAQRNEYNFDDSALENVTRMVEFSYKQDYSDDSFISTSTSADNSASDTETASTDTSASASNTETAATDTSASDTETTSVIESLPFSNALQVNAQMYVMGDKYNVTALKELAIKKYIAALPVGWNSESFTNSVYEIYEGTPEEANGLKDVAIKFAATKAKELMDRGDFITVLKDIPGFAVEVLRVSLENTTGGGIRYAVPTCPKCHSMDYVQVSRKDKTKTWYCGSSICKDVFNA